jgi:hypothetical protein
MGDPDFRREVSGVRFSDVLCSIRFHLARQFAEDEPVKVNLVTIVFKKNIFC